MSKRLLLLLNARAAEDEALAEAVEQVRQRGHTLDVRTLGEPGVAWRLAAEAVRAGADVVLAAGGDGTLNEVVNGVVEASGTERRCAVGVVPYGTANDFATACGLADLAPQDILLLAAEGIPTPIDIGKANDRHFVNMASGGFGAEVTASTPGPLKNLLGGMAYTLTGLVMLLDDEQRHVYLRGPNWTWDGRLLLLAVGNGRRAGGGYEVAPQAMLDDGLLDVAVIPSVGLIEVPDLVGELFEEDVINLRLTDYRQLPWLEVEAPAGLHVNLDGEPVESTAFRFEVLPRHLPFFLPPSALSFSPSPPPVGEGRGGEGAGGRGSKSRGPTGDAFSPPPC